jgi:hypothetical protein
VNQIRGYSGENAKGLLGNIPLSVRTDVPRETPGNAAREISVDNFR